MDGHNIASYIFRLLQDIHNDAYDLNIKFYTLQHYSLTRVVVLPKRATLKYELSAVREEQIRIVYCIVYTMRPDLSVRAVQRLN